MIFHFFLLIFICIIDNTTYTISHKTLILVPAEQGVSCCRTIGDYYVNGLNIAFCEALAKLIEQKKNNCSVCIIKAPVSTQSHSFALAEEINKKNPNLVIHIGLCPQSGEVPSVYFFCYDHSNPMIKQSNQSSLPALVKVEHAHLCNSKKSFESAVIAEKIIDHFTEKGLYKSFPVKKIPFVPLKGIVSSAFACEIGIEKPYDWKKLVVDIADACIAALYS
jgi:hypothetical protein